MATKTPVDVDVLRGEASAKTFDTMGVNIRGRKPG